jgi:3-methyladenine DNA glycosylase/8-oxoguanine DNA glycosylase
MNEISLATTLSQSSQLPQHFTFYLQYEQPFLWEKLLAFYRYRMLEGVELIGQDFYARTVRLCGEGACSNVGAVVGENVCGSADVSAGESARGKAGEGAGENARSHAGEGENSPLTGWIFVQNDVENSRLAVCASTSLVPARANLERRIRQMFDLDCNVQASYAELASLDQKVPGAVKCGTRVPGSFDSFEIACRAIIGQQVSVLAANKIAARIVEHYGTRIETGIEGLISAFPTPAEVLAIENPEEAFGLLGVIKTRTRTMCEIARLIESGALDFSVSCKGNEEQGSALVAQLQSIKGIGPWSANYIVMRVAAFDDAFLETDAGVKHALPDFSPRERLELSQGWRPYRSYAVLSLWNSLV